MDVVPGVLKLAEEGEVVGIHAYLAIPGALDKAGHEDPAKGLGHDAPLPQDPVGVGAEGNGGAELVGEAGLLVELGWSLVLVW